MARRATRAEEIAALEALAFPREGVPAEVTARALVEVERVVREQAAEDYVNFDWREQR